MDQLSLRIEDDACRFRPGDCLRGRVEWQLAKPGEALELRLFWFTQGAGDRDTDVVATIRFEHPEERGQQAFELELPPGPYSFVGRLTSLTWALEFLDTESSAMDHVEIELVPDDGPVRLEAIGSAPVP